MRIGTKTNLKTESFAVFESSRFVTTERWSSRRNVFALQICVSICLLYLSSLVNITPRYLNFSTCCSVLLPISNIHWLGGGFWRDMIAWSHAAENRSSACWRPCSEDVSSTRPSAKASDRHVDSAVTVYPTRYLLPLKQTN